VEGRSGMLRGRNGSLASLGLVLGPAMATAPAYETPSMSSSLQGGYERASPNATCKSHARVDMVTKKDTTVALRDRGQRCPGAACVMQSKHYFSEHRTTSSATPTRNCSMSPSSTPSMRRPLGLSLFQTSGKWSRQ
jgi:hypothetical protein